MAAAPAVQRWRLPLLRVDHLVVASLDATSFLNDAIEELMT